MPSIVSAIADAITRQEGFFPGSAAYKNNNPGNIMDLEYYKATGGKFKLQAYATLEEGRAALEKLIGNYIKAGHTLSTFFAKYAPSGHGGNDPSVYARNVAEWTGLPVDVPLNSLGSTAPSQPSTPSPSPNLSPDFIGGILGGEGNDSYYLLLGGVAVLGLAIWIWMD